uniref:Uncharacterized protein n=1 Tax=Anguilla anguilla TaxID=7936 RepID=A0A0E9W0Y3_ANGAN
MISSCQPAVPWPALSKGTLHSFLVLQREMNIRLALTSDNLFMNEAQRKTVPLQVQFTPQLKWLKWLY